MPLYRIYVYLELVFFPFFDIIATVTEESQRLWNGFQNFESRRFLVKMGGNPCRGTVYKRERKHCFSSVMHEFCINKLTKLFSKASLSFTMFIFLLTPFGTWVLLFWIKSQPGVIYKSVANEKTLHL